MCTGLPKRNTSDVDLTASDAPIVVAGTRSRPNVPLGAAAAVTAAAVMAGYVVLGKQFVGQAGSSASDVGLFLLARQLIAAVLMVLLAVGKHGTGQMLPRPEHRRALGMLGLLNFINAVGFVWGVRLTTAFVTSVMQLSIPVLTLLYSTLAGLEPPSLTKTASLLVTVLGCALVTTGSAREPGDGGASLSLGVGVLVLFAQCSSFVALVVVQKRVLEFYPVAVVVGWSYCLCTAWSCVYCLLDGSLFRLAELATRSTAGLAIIAYSAVFGAVAYFELLGIATKHLSPTLVTISVALEPLGVSAIGVCFFGYRLNASEIAGYTCAAVGCTSLAYAYARTDELACARGGGAGGCGGASVKPSYRMEMVAVGASNSSSEEETGALLSTPLRGGARARS